MIVLTETGFEVDGLKVTMRSPGCYNFTTIELVDSIAHIIGTLAVSIASAEEYEDVLTHLLIIDQKAAGMSHAYRHPLARGVMLDVVIPGESPTSPSWTGTGWVGNGGWAATSGTANSSTVYQHWSWMAP